MRQLAWFRATPEDSEKSRGEMWAEQGRLLYMPDLDGFELFVEWLDELGYAEQTVNGLVSIGWSDIAGWANATGTELQPWMVVTLRKLSSVYAEQAGISRGKLVPPPYQEEVTQAEMAEIRKRTDSKVRGIFGG